MVTHSALFLRPEPRLDIFIIKLDGQRHELPRRHTADRPSTRLGEPSPEPGALIWYKNSTASTTGGTSLAAANGAQTNSYTPQSGTAGTFYYYCIVTGTCGTATSAVSGAFIVNAPSFTPAVRHVSDLTATGQNIKWYAAASGGSALTSTDVLPTGTTHYFASQTVNNVESTARLDVTATILSTPCVPTGTAIQTYSAGSTVASLQATGSGIRWYAAESGGAALATSTALVNGVHYWATQTVSCTESATRLEVIVTIN